MAPTDNMADPSIVPRNLARVLLVDDISINREILRNFLEASVRLIDEAADGLEALEYFKQHRYDAILLDIEMPRLDGYETLRAMRAWELAHNLPPAFVLAVTTSDFPEDRQRALAAGATDYMAKPVKKPELLAMLHIHQAAPSVSHPLANLLPQLFAYAEDALNRLEAEGFNNLEAASKGIHGLRGAMATYGFENFADRLKQMQLMARSGFFPDAAEFDELRRELRRLRGLTPP